MAIICLFLALRHDYFACKILEIGDWRYYYLIFDIGYLEFGFRSFDTGS